MTESVAPRDLTMETITAAVNLGRAGDVERARRDLFALWHETGVAGDPFHRCTLAHYLADLYAHPAEALVWDIRALDAADDLTDVRAQQHHASLHVAGFYPSLYLNVADNFRRLGAFEAAAEHITNAEQHTSALSDDAYGSAIHAAIREVHEAIDQRNSARRASAPGAND